LCSLEVCMIHVPNEVMAGIRRPESAPGCGLLLADMRSMDP
jgi:hypothetical protein